MHVWFPAGFGGAYHAGGSYQEAGHVDPELEFDREVSEGGGRHVW